MHCAGGHENGDVEHEDQEKEAPAEKVDVYERLLKVAKAECRQRRAKEEAQLRDQEEVKQLKDVDEQKDQSSSSSSKAEASRRKWFEVFQPELERKKAEKMVVRKEKQAELRRRIDEHGEKAKTMPSFMIGMNASSVFFCYLGEFSTE